MLHLFSETFNLSKPGDASTAGTEDQSDLLEALSLKERMARYQAAVSRGDTRSFSANVSSSVEFCGSDMYAVCPHFSITSEKPE